MVHVPGIIGLRLERATIRFVAVAILGASLVILALSLAVSVGGRTMFGPALGADYAGFYAAAKVFHDYGPERLYDLPLQDRVYHSVIPSLPAEQKLPYVHPPFVAAVLSPLAAVPYRVSFLIWLGVSLGLYAGGVLLLCSALDHIPRAEQGLVLLLALSVQPFVMECWLGGQLSAIGFFWLALAVRCDLRGRYLASGLALGFCLYKPTLLFLLLPMLIIGRCWRTLAGFALTAGALATASLMLVGFRGCIDYWHLLWGFADTATGGVPIFRLSKYVDLNTFLRLLPGVPIAFAHWLGVAIVLAAFVCLARLWWTMRQGTQRRSLIWAVTIAATPVVNVYVGVYDAVLVVLAVLLMANALRRTGPDATEPLPRTFRNLLLLLYIAPWFTQLLARAVGVQLLTVVLAALAAYGWLIVSKGRLTPDAGLATARY